MLPALGTGGDVLFLNAEEKQELLQFANETEPTNHPIYQFQEDMRRNIENAKTDKELKLLLNYKLLEKPTWNKETKTYQAVVELSRGDKFLIDINTSFDGKAKMTVFDIFEPFDDDDPMETFIDEEPVVLHEKISSMIWNDIKEDIEKDMKTRLFDLLFKN